MNIDLPESVFDDATMFNKNLSIVSLAGSFQTGKAAKISKFYTDAGFDNIKTSDDYDSSSADSISYSLIEELASYGAIKMLEWLVVEDSFYNALCPILIAKGITYDPDKLKETCNAFFQMVDFKGTNGCLSYALQKILP